MPNDAEMKEIKVRPVRKYKVPKYPCSKEGNPIDSPELMAYPFKYRLVNALVGAGIFSSLGFYLVSCTSAEGKPLSNTPITHIDVENPFTLKDAGLPYMAPSFGTGLPARLESEKARKTIQRIFEEEGLQPQIKVKYLKDGISLVLDGMDPETGIGYVWIDGSNLEPNALLNYETRKYRTPSVRDVAFLQRLKQEFKNWEREDIVNGIWRIGEMEDDEEKRVALQQLVRVRACFLEYYKGIDSGYVSTGSSAEAVNASSSEEMNDWARVFELEQLKDFYFPMNHIDGFPKEAMNTFRKVEKTKLPQEKVQLYESLYHPINDQNLGLDEFITMQKEKHPVALISKWDPRFARAESLGYPWAMQSLIEFAETEEEKTKYQAQLDEYNKGGEALIELEKQVRVFIKWAKTQQGY